MTGKNIRYLRENAGMKIPELAALLDVSADAMDKMESGETEVPASVLPALSGKFRISLRSLISEDVEKQYNLRRNFDCRLLAMDVDGVLTDGGMYYSEQGDELKKFSAKDGLALIRMADAGIPTALISSGTNESLMKRRAAQLRIPLVCTGTWTKTRALENWCKELGVEMKQVAYIGDDLNDLPVFPLVGLSACPSDAAESVKENVDVILETRGGAGCVREFCERFIINMEK
jgi:3-deoxy-D-manno-octulosonate 8-phosphate phosphatase (KDO 8-P phosphatase)